MTIDEQIPLLEQLQEKLQNEVGASVLPHAIESLKLLRKITGGKQDIQHYRQFVAMYDAWMRKTSGVSAKITAGDGKALKQIIRYLVENSKGGDEEGAMDAWHYILKYWKLLTPFLQTQVRLSQINKNLPEILMQLRNGKKPGQNRRDLKEELKRRRRRD